MTEEKRIMLMGDASGPVHSALTAKQLGAPMLALFTSSRRLVRFARNAIRYLWQDRWTFVTAPVLFSIRPILRRRAALPGYTVLIANWQTTEFLEFTVQQVKALSPPETVVVVVDNASSDGRGEALRRLPVKLILLPLNVGHGVALDIAALYVRTEYLVALDVDAFPISPDWLWTLSDPLISGCTVSGAEASNGQIAPCCLMMRTERFVERRHRFVSRMVPGNEPMLRPENFWDVGRGISVREGPDNLHPVRRTGYLRPSEQVGEIFDGILYHNGYSTVDGLAQSRGSVSKELALEVWRDATRQFEATRDA